MCVCVCVCLCVCVRRTVDVCLCTPVCNRDSSCVCVCVLYVCVFCQQWGWLLMFVTLALVRINAFSSMACMFVMEKCVCVCVRMLACVIMVAYAVKPTQPQPASWIKFCLYLAFADCLRGHYSHTNTRFTYACTGI